MKLSTPSIRITIDSSDIPYFYADNKRIPMRSVFPDATIEAEFRAVPYFNKQLGKEILYMIIDPELSDEDSQRTALLRVKEESWHQK